MREKLLNVLKFFFFILLIPIVVATVISFGQQLYALEENPRNMLLGGLYLYVVMHLFFFEPMDLYNFGQGLIYSLLKFSQPVAIVGKYVLPFYAFLFCLAYYFAVVLAGIGGIWPSFILLFIGFTMAMHVILTAHTLHEEDTSSFKPHYFSTMALTYLASTTLLACFLSLIFKEFSLSEFLGTVFNISELIYSRAFQQLFVPSS